jgi:regulator of sirC expression with transglutaminase-like and TPR domain
MELARRLGLTVVGVGLPGHFVVRHEPANGESRIIDVFEGGKFLTREDAEQRVKEMTGTELKPAMLKAVSKKAIVVRMLTNLVGVARRESDTAAALRYTECIVALEPDSARDRAARMALRAELGQREAALEDLDWLLEHPSEEIDAEKLRAFRRFLTRPDK